MKKNSSKFFVYSEDRSILINILCFLFAIIGLFLVPIIISNALNYIFNNAHISSLLANFIFIIILFTLYIKDLKKEWKIFINDFGKNIKISLKFYICGFLLMVLFNVIIQNVFNYGVSANEQQVRNTLFSFPVFSIISISVIAPLCEELIFRKSLMPLCKNKWVYATISGLLFGAPHLFAGSFTLSNLVFLLPYSSLGFMFAYMNYETKTTFSSITMHFIHNTFTVILLFIASSYGAV